MSAAPPFRITDAIVGLVGEIERRVGAVGGITARAPEPKLRKANRIRTVHGTIALEGNPLTEAQITAVLAGKRVVGVPRELLEATNANAAYDRAAGLRAGSERDLLAAHRVLMQGLADPAGRYRTTEVGVIAGTRIRHMAPPAKRVAALVRALLGWMRTTKTPVLIRSCVIHYELAFIHPFIDGNGRIARLWQHVTLQAASPLYAHVPVESVIRNRQRGYYSVLNRCDHAGDSTEFIEFALEALRDAMMAMAPTVSPQHDTPMSRLEVGKAHFGRGWFSRLGYLALHGSISTATASRDLATGVQTGQLVASGAHRLTVYRYR